jgi:hypothetical protein
VRRRRRFVLRFILAAALLSLFQYVWPPNHPTVHDDRLLNAVVGGLALAASIFVVGLIIRRIGGDGRGAVRHAVRQRRRDLNGRQRRRFGWAFLAGKVPTDEKLFPLARANAHLLLRRRLPFEEIQDRFSGPLALVAAVAWVVGAIAGAPTGIVVPIFLVFVLALASAVGSRNRSWARRVEDTLGPA